MAIAREGHYVLHNDIECAGFDMGDGAGFWPVGSAAQPFRGALWAGSFEIRGLRIMRPHDDAVGLFGVTSGAELHGVKLRKATILGGHGVAGVVGRAIATTIDATAADTPCQVDGIIGGQHDVSSVVGIMESGTNPSAACVSTARVTSFE